MIVSSANCSNFAGSGELTKSYYHQPDFTIPPSAALEMTERIENLE